MSGGTPLTDRELLVEVLRSLREAREAVNRAEDALLDRVTAQILANQTDTTDEPSPCDSSVEAPPVSSPAPEEPSTRNEKLIAARKAKGDCWTEEEEGLLREHFPALGAQGCMVHLPRRTKQAIAVRASNLGLSKIGREAPVRANGWTKGELSTLIENYAEKGSVATAALLPGRSPESVIRRARKLGLSVPRETHSRLKREGMRRRRETPPAPVAPLPSPKIEMRLRSFEEQLALVAAGKARIIEKPVMPSRQYDRTLGGVAEVGI